jgi:hypothetical protein
MSVCTRRNGRCENKIGPDQSTNWRVERRTGFSMLAGRALCPVDCSLDPTTRIGKLRLYQRLRPGDRFGVVVAVADAVLSPAPPHAVVAEILARLMIVVRPWMRHWIPNATRGGPADLGQTSTAVVMQSGAFPQSATECSQRPKPLRSISSKSRMGNLPNSIVSDRSRRGGVGCWHRWRPSGA